MRYFLTTLLWLVLNTSYTPSYGQCPGVIDYQALVDLYEDTEGIGWMNQGGWLQNCDISTWDGVTVEDGRVTRLVLNSNNLEGELPSSIGTLTSLGSYGIIRTTRFYTYIITGIYQELSPQQ